ncbi:hypothetical protein YPPY66_1972, partial [Yersinia pestis PY-66]
MAFNTITSFLAFI